MSTSDRMFRSTAGGGLRSSELKRTEGPKRKGWMQRGTKPLPFRSKKTEALYRKRRVIVAERIGDGTTPCEARIPDVCTGIAQDVHEIVRRSQANVLLNEDVMADVCRACHDWIGDNVNAAEALGLYVRGSTYRANGNRLPSVTHSSSPTNPLTVHRETGDH